LFTNSSVGRQYFENASKKTTNLASINMTQLRNCPFPIPPVDEQDRILKKVNELNVLCDELEAGLVQAQTEGGKLMEAVVHHVQAG
jgi:type I restriction enzyme S subunit